MDGLFPDVSFGDWLNRRTDVQANVRDSDYTQWFSDRLSHKRMQTLSQKLEAARGEAEKEQALLEGRSAMVLYSMLIYYFYPAVPAMKREIDSNPELKENFNRLKGWFDQNGGNRIAEDFYKEMLKSMEQHKVD